MDHSIYIFGMKFPNRIFVGGLPKRAEAREIADFFEIYGTVTEAKVILSETGESKGYGFITFQTRNDVENVLKQGQLFFQGKKLNLGPAVRKQVPDVQGEPVIVVQHPSDSQQEKSPPPIPMSTRSSPMPIIPYYGQPQYPTAPTSRQKSSPQIPLQSPSSQMSIPFYYGQPQFFCSYY